MSIDLVLLKLNETKCNGIIIKFLKNDPSYGRYDLIPVAQDDILTRDDIVLARNVGAIFFDETVVQLMQRSAVINEALAQVHPSISILDSYVKIPWLELENLFGKMNIPHFKMANITKVLHKKRPKLIPVLDSVVVERLLGPLLRINYSGPPLSFEKTMVKYVELFKHIADDNVLLLTKLRQKYRITEVRILDVLIWTILRSPPWLSNSVAGTAVTGAAKATSSLGIHEKARDAYIRNGCKPLLWGELYSQTMKYHGSIKRSSFQPADWTVNENSGYYLDKATDSYKDKTHKIFFKRDDNRFELYDPGVHGLWIRDQSGCRRID